MDSLKKNKFLSTFLAVVVVGVLGLGFLLFSSIQANKAAAEAFDTEKKAVAALEQKPLYPNKSNLDARLAQVGQFAATVTQLQQGLLASQPAVDTEAASDKFQTKLNETLSAIDIQKEITTLSSRGAPKFDLGFGKYLENLPPRQAVPDLMYQLGAVEAMVRTMLTDRVSSIDDIARAELDVETAKPDSADEAKPAASKNAPKKAAAGPAPALAENLVLKRYPMEVRFTGSPRSVQDVLNHLASSKDYFFAIRSLRIENERKVGPPKGTVAEASSEESKKDSDVVLGGEKVTAWLALDVIRFLDPAVAMTDAKKPAAK